MPIWTQSNDNELSCYKHIIIGSYIIHIEKATADLESKYRKVCRLFAYKINELRYFEGQNSEF